LSTPGTKMVLTDPASANQANTQAPHTLPPDMRNAAVRRLWQFDGPAAIRKVSVKRACRTFVNNPHCFQVAGSRTESRSERCASTLKRPKRPASRERQYRHRAFRYSLLLTIVRRSVGSPDGREVPCPVEK
jgi:hypothetical protein